MLLVKQTYAPSLKLFPVVQTSSTYFTTLKNTWFRGKAHLILSHSQLIWVSRKVNNAMHWINRYPGDSVVCFVNPYPLDSDLKSSRDLFGG